MSPSVQETDFQKERSMLSRRDALKALGVTAATLAVAPLVRGQNTPAGPPAVTPAGPFQLPALGYALDALEPYIDAQTMQIHHDKHHAAYVANLNAAVADLPDIAKMSIEEILADLSKIPEAARTKIRNNGGGHANHSLFWTLLKKNETGKPVGGLAAAIDKDLGGFDTFKKNFTAAAMGVFGSGWAWLTLKNGKLQITSLPNQDSPLSSAETPILGLDVWEHAYYLKYQNLRTNYVAAFFNVINWDTANDQFKKARA
jgi:Fe-Mn family superoxide dismutase